MLGGDALTPGASRRGRFPKVLTTASAFSFQLCIYELLARQHALRFAEPVAICVAAPALLDTTGLWA